MLSDLITSLTTSLSPHLRSMGYLDETLAMRARSLRNREAWQPHLDRTREFVLSTVRACARKRTIVILGSGLLLDVPLFELAGMFEHVLLMDVVCLPEIRREIGRYPNVRFLEHDVSGVAEKLYQNISGGLSTLPAPVSPAAAYADADLVVSLNILSQLWVVLRAFIGRFRQSPEQIDEWCASIVEAHYTTLRSLDCGTCLVADHEFVKRDCEGAVISRGSTVYSLNLPEPDASWTWNIAPIRKDSPHASKELLVGAWHFQRSP